MKALYMTLSVKNQKVGVALDVWPEAHDCDLVYFFTSEDKYRDTADVKVVRYLAGMTEGQLAGVIEGYVEHNIIHAGSTNALLNIGFGEH